MGKLSQSYLKELAEKKKYKSGGFSTEGYKRNSPDVNNPYNIIPSNQITMEEVDFPVMGIDDMGNQQMMYPGNNYTFPGNYVTEFPVKNMGNKRFGQVGLEKRMPWEKPTIQDWNKLIKGEYKPEKDLGKEIERQSRPEGAKPIEEVLITEEGPGVMSRIRNTIKPYVAPEGGFMDQWRQRIIDATGGSNWYKQPNSVLGAFGSVITAPLAAPQYGAVYGLTGKVQTPSEALNIQNPVGAFVTDVALDPMTYLGVGASKIPQKVSQAVKPALRGASEYLTTQTPLKNIIKTPFKSEIDWSKWNKRIPNKPGRVEEYNAIEKATKEAGTWMKNPDGTPFTLPDGTPGTPEQFVQMQSQNFKKLLEEWQSSSPKELDLTYRGAQVFYPTLGRASKSGDDLADVASNYILFGTENPSVAKGYATNYGYNLNEFFQEKGIDVPFFHPDINKTIAYNSDMFADNPAANAGIYGYVTPKNTQKLISNANKERWMNVENKEVNDWLKKTNLDEYNFRKRNNYWLPDKVSTDNIAAYIKEKNIPVAEIKNVHDGVDYFGNPVPSNVRAINRSMINPKSLWYNDGDFNLSNPDAFGAILPYAIPTSLGVGALQQYYNQKPKATYQMGGTMGIPGVNGQVVSSGPQPLTSVKKTRGPITKTKKGDVKTMPTKAVKKILKNIK